MSSNLLIVSDGTCKGTYVRCEGETIEGVTAVRIHEIKPDGVIKASIDVIAPRLIIEARTDDIKTSCKDRVDMEKSHD